MWISDHKELSYSVTNMLRKVYLTQESYLLNRIHTVSSIFLCSVFTYQKHDIALPVQHTTENRKLGTTVRSPQDIKIFSNQISQLFLAFSAEAGALNCISLFLPIFWCHPFSSYQYKNGYPHDKRLVSSFDFNFFCRKRLRMHSQKDCLK